MARRRWNGRRRAGNYSSRIIKTNRVGFWTAVARRWATMAGETSRVGAGLAHSIRELGWLRRFT